LRWGKVESFAALLVRGSLHNLWLPTFSGKSAVLRVVVTLFLCLVFTRASGAQTAAGSKQTAFIAKRPAAATQTQKTARERGINPCATPEPGFGIYRPWQRGIGGYGQFIMPQRGGITRNGEFDVMFHFHGHEPARKEWVQIMDGAVLVGIDLGTGSGYYEQAFVAPDAFETLLHNVEAAVAKTSGRASARARKIGLSGWSAGYGAIQRILAQPLGKTRVDAVVLLDGLHCGYAGQSLNEIQISPFIEYANRAARGERIMFVSHSSIIPPGYASTTETANFLIHKVGGKPRTVRGAGPMGLDLISRFSKGNFHVRGYSGNDKMDHCAHLGLYRDILKLHIKPRWKSPRGFARKNAKAEQ
jgi:hypothetical protein